MSDNELRTSAIGLFNYAESYRRAALSLKAEENMWTHPYAPIVYLFSHSIELFLKSYLRKSHSLNELRSIGHNISNLYNTSKNIGLEKLPATEHLINNFKLSYFLEVRYIKTSHKEAPSIELLSYVSAEICKAAHFSFLDEFKYLGHDLNIVNIFNSETFNVSLIHN